MARRRNAAREARRAARRAPRPPDAPSPWPFVGMGVMAASLFLHGAAALVAPWWGVALLLVLWWALARSARRWPSAASLRAEKAAAQEVSGG